MRVRTQCRIWLPGAVGLAVIVLACGGPAVDGSATPASTNAPARSDSGRPPCVHAQSGFRSGVNPPREVHRVEPDLSGLPPLDGEQIVIIEVRIDASGQVTESCMLRGIREDLDARALEAVKSWRFEPPRLLADTALLSGGKLEAGTAVPVFMTVIVQLGRKGT